MIATPEKSHDVMTPTNDIVDSSLDLLTQYMRFIKLRCVYERKAHKSVGKGKIMRTIFVLDLSMAHLVMDHAENDLSQHEYNVLFEFVREMSMYLPQIRGRTIDDRTDPWEWAMYHTHCVICRRDDAPREAYGGKCRSCYSVAYRRQMQVIRIERAIDTKEQSRETDHANIDNHDHGTRLLGTGGDDPTAG